MIDNRETNATVRVGSYSIGSVRWADLGPMGEGYSFRALEAVRDMCTERLGEWLPPAPPPDPIPMRLPCPSCGELHIDEGEWAHRLHHTHACQHCGMVWRPAVVDTVGVRFLPGFVNDDQPPTDDEPERYPTAACARCGGQFSPLERGVPMCEQCQPSFAFAAVEHTQEGT